jgi:hypothetical protein
MCLAGNLGVPGSISSLETQMILVTGATGKNGVEILKRLSGSGERKDVTGEATRPFTVFARDNRLAFLNPAA